MELKIKTGINYDYILTTELDKNGRLEMKEVSIERNTQVIEKLIKMVNNPIYDITDMHQSMYKIKREDEYKYCLSHAYTDTFIKPIIFPEVDEYKYRTELNKFKEKETERQRYRTKRKYNYKKISKEEFEKEVTLMVEQNLAEKSQSEKEEYLPKCLYYIYASDYHRALTRIKTNHSVNSYSYEEHGRHVFNHSINDDLKVCIRTNFCYGSASYLQVIVTYKGIPLLPYSTWVKYYIARYSELLKCTRSYISKRSSWNDCIYFIRDFINNAIDNPEKFVKETIMQEVNDMMEGLYEIYKDGHNSFNRIFSDFHEPSQNYIGFRFARNINSSEQTNYNIYPHEMYLVYRIGKITGALRFLESLEKISVISPEIKEIIHEIKSMNILIYPEVSKELIPIEADVKKLQKLYNAQDAALTKLRSKFEKEAKKLKKYLSYFKKEEQKIKKEKYLKEFPIYKKLCNDLNKQQETVNMIKKDLYNRDKFLKDLTSFKELIEKHAV